MYVSYPVDASTADGAPVLWQMDPWRAPIELAGPVQGIISSANLAQRAPATVTVGGVECAVVKITPNRIYFELPSVGVTGSHGAVVTSGQLTLKLASHFVSLLPL